MVFFTFIFINYLQPDLVERAIIVDVSPKPFDLSSSSIKILQNNFKIMREVNLPKGLTIHEARQMVDRQLKVKLTDKSLRDFLLTNLVLSEDNTR